MTKNKKEYIDDFTTVKKKGLVNYLYETNLEEIGIKGYFKRGFIIPFYSFEINRNNKIFNDNPFNYAMLNSMAGFGEFIKSIFIYIPTYKGYKQLFELGNYFIQNL